MHKMKGQEMHSSRTIRTLGVRLASIELAGETQAAAAAQSTHK
jgi:hypothetical protein